MIKAIFYALLAVISILLPITYIKRVKKQNSGCNLKSVWHGVSVYFLFGAVLNGIIYTLVFNYTNPLSAFRQSVWLTGLCIGLIHTVCIILGRFIWCNTLMAGSVGEANGKLFGAGYALGMQAMGYTLPALASVVFAIMEAIETTKDVPMLFSDLADATVVTAAHEVIFVFIDSAVFTVLEIMLGAMLYNVCKKIVKPGFFVAAFVLSLASYTALSFPLINDVLRAVILICCAAISVGVYFASRKKAK